MSVRPVSGGFVLLLASCGGDVAGPVEPVQGDWVQVGAGGEYSCGLTAAGAVYCWGRRKSPQYGEADPPHRRVPVPLHGGPDFVQLGVGGHASCAVTQDAQVHCWTLADSVVPPPPPVGGPVFEVSTGGAQFCQLIGQEIICLATTHACGLAGNGLLRCWGSNSYGQLGISGGYVDGSVLVPGGHHFVEVSAGSRHTCGRVWAGDLLCWGANWSGQLGRGGPEDQRENPVPEPVMGGHRFVQVSAGEQHTCGRTDEGKLLCWGWNQYGQLGDGGTANSSSPLPVQGGHDFVEVSAGSRHTCARRQAGRLYCWGDNEYGQLGDGTTTTRASPVRVSSALVFVEVSAGNRHTCARTQGGNLHCWGDNEYGQLGDGSLVHSSLPVPVAPPAGSGATAVAAARTAVSLLRHRRAPARRVARSRQL